MLIKLEPDTPMFMDPSIPTSEKTKHMKKLMIDNMLSKMQAHPQTLIM